MLLYPAIVLKDGTSDYGVSFPDVPGVVTAGLTLEEAYGFAQEALALHLNGMAEDAEPWPTPSKDALELALADPENDGAVVFLVPVAQQKAAA